MAQLHDLLVDVPVEERMRVAFDEAPGWVWLVSDPAVDHVLVDNPIALVNGWLDKRTTVAGGSTRCCAN